MVRCRAQNGPIKKGKLIGHFGVRDPKMVAFETMKLDISGPPRIKILYSVCDVIISNMFATWSSVRVSDMF